MLKVKNAADFQANCPNFSVELLGLPLVHVVPCVQIWPFKAGANPMNLYDLKLRHVESLSMPVVWVVIHPEKAGPEFSSLDSGPWPPNITLQTNVIFFVVSHLSGASCGIRRWKWVLKPTPLDCKNLDRRKSQANTSLSFGTLHWTQCWQHSSFVPQLRNIKYGKNVRMSSNEF